MRDISVEDWTITEARAQDKRQGVKKVQIIRCSFQNKKVVIQHMSPWVWHDTNKNISGKKHRKGKCWLLEISASSSSKFA